MRSNSNQIDILQKYLPMPRIIGHCDSVVMVKYRKLWKHVGFLLIPSWYLSRVLGESSI